MTLTCIAKDNFTEKTVQIVKTFDVNVATEFLHVQKTGDSNSSYRRAYADLYLVNAGTIRFQVNAARTNARVYVKLGAASPIEITGLDWSVIIPFHRALPYAIAIRPLAFCLSSFALNYYL
jgi:hypothetical protein